MRKPFAFLAGFLGTLAILLAIAGPALGQACWATDTLPIRLDTLGASNIHRLSGDRLKAATRWFNAMEPQTEGEYENIILANTPDGGGLVLIGRSADSICTKMAVPAPQWLGLQAAILGQAV
jgi:hypothetical protein